MGSEKIWEELMALSITCGMNQRYSQYMLGKAERWVNLIDISVVAFTVLTLVLGILAMFVPGKKLFKRPRILVRMGLSKVGGLSVWASVLAAIAGVILIVTPASDEAHHFNRMFQAWSDLRQDVDSVVVDADSTKLLGDEGQAYLERRYRELLAKKNALNAREPSADQKLLDEFLAQEERSRGVKGDCQSPPGEHQADQIQNASTLATGNN